MTDRFDLGPPPLLAYSTCFVDRAAHRRNEIGALEAAPGAATYAIAGEAILLRKFNGAFNPLFTLEEARALGAPREKIFLGLAGVEPRFALSLDPSAAERLKAQGDHYVIDLRSIAMQGLLGPEHLAPLAEGKAMLLWHARHGFCANCGTQTTASEGGWRRDCAHCKVQHFPRTDPVVIMLAIDGDRCLLGRQARFGAGMWSCLAGFVEPGETIEEAVRREVMEEAGIACGDVKYFATQPWPFPMSLMIGCHARATTNDIKVDTTELEDARWFSRQEAAEMLLRRHTQGLSTPPSAAIAYHIIRAWVEGNVNVGA
jgi:NAD+ diphosphatase